VIKTNFVSSHYKIKIKVMATRSLIGKQNADGTVSMNYCHWDGYPENNGNLLVENYGSPFQVDELLALGDLSYLGYSPSMSHAYARDMKRSFTGLQTVNRDQIGVTAEACGADYVYIYNDEFEWECFDEAGAYIKILADVA
jgi:hypothetical protein